MVYSRVEFLLGGRDILEPKVTCQRTFVRISHDVFDHEDDDKVSIGYVYYD